MMQTRLPACVLNLISGAGSAVAAVFLLVSAATGPVQAASAKVKLTFSGSYKSSTCAVESVVNQDVSLPTLSSAALPAKGSVAGATPFTIKVKCGSGVSKVRAFFQKSGTTDPVTGNLKLLPVAGRPTAGNVQIQLLNQDSTAISVGVDTSVNPIKPGSDGAASLHYHAQYYATGKATAGTANTNVIYVIEMP
ncbi:fimbrial protein [Paraherbaspirillum soli]|uniref:Fimbrial protein n=1 Tax=Paraherbaspirillum soli TaxID=631222 RepID=A0ABW0M2X8_9BURK